MKGKPIQIITSGLENNETTQTSYVITMLTDAGEIFQKTSLSPTEKWVEVDYSNIEYINREEKKEEIKSNKCIYCGTFK